MNFFILDKNENSLYFEKDDNYNENMNHSIEEEDNLDLEKDLVANSNVFDISNIKMKKDFFLFLNLILKLIT